MTLEGKGTQDLSMELGMCVEGRKSHLEKEKENMTVSHQVNPLQRADLAAFVYFCKDFQKAMRIIYQERLLIRL